MNTLRWLCSSRIVETCMMLITVNSIQNIIYVGCDSLIPFFLLLIMTAVMKILTAIPTTNVKLIPNPDGIAYTRARFSVDLDSYRRRLSIICSLS